MMKYISCSSLLKKGEESSVLFARKPVEPVTRMHLSFNFFAMPSTSMETIKYETAMRIRDKEREVEFETLSMRLHMNI